MPVLREGELSVNYLDDGAGSAVALVYSSVSGNKQGRQLVASLGPTYRCVAPNLLGYGLISPWQTRRKQTLADAAQVTLALCKKTIPDPIHLVGHSWGGAVALETDNKLGTRVSHLALYDCMVCDLLHTGGETKAWLKAMGIYTAVPMPSDAQDGAALAELCTDYFNGDGSWAATPAEQQSVIASQLPPNRHEGDASSQPTIAQDFGGVTAQTLVLRDKSKAMNCGRFMQKDGHRSNSSFDAAIYPANFALLGKQNADIPGTHEASSCHSFGYQSQFSSTAQDIERGKATGADYVNDLIVRRGETLGISTPANRALWAGVKLIKCKAIDEASDTSLDK